MAKFLVRTDGNPKYYDSAMEAILRYAEAKDKCKSFVSVWCKDSMLAHYVASLPEYNEVIVPQSEWFHL